MNCVDCTCTYESCSCYIEGATCAYEDKPKTNNADKPKNEENAEK